MAAVMACSSIAASAATVPNATIDTTRKTSLELYKYDFTTAHEDGKLNTDSYVSTGLPVRLKPHWQTTPFRALSSPIQRSRT